MEMYISTDFCTCDTAADQRTTNDLAKNSMFPIQVPRTLKRHKKLRTIRIRSCVTHGDNSSCIMHEAMVKFVFKSWTPYRCSTFSGPCWISTLGHEILNNSVERRSVIIARLCQCKPVFTRLRCEIAVKLDIQVSKTGMYSSIPATTRDSGHRNIR